MSNHFTIKIPCKKYVRAYLENNCGSPVNLQHLPDMMEEFRRGLSRKPALRGSSEPGVCTDVVTIIIPDDMFYRYGWEMNRENIIDFNRNAELRVKSFMRLFISLNHSLGTPVADCIRVFQEDFGYPEPIWTYEAIKKDFDRHGKGLQLKTIRDLKAEMNKILLDNLSDLGTISKKLKKEYVYG